MLCEVQEDMYLIHLSILLILQRKNECVTKGEYTIDMIGLELNCNYVCQSCIQQEFWIPEFHVASAYYL